MSLDKYKKIFEQKRNYSIGVEEEFMICNPDSGELINKANEIMNQVSDLDRYSYELLLSEIEINTSVCDSFIWPTTGLTYANTGIFTYTSVNLNTGCPNIDTLDLIILPNTSSLSSITNKIA